MGVVSTWTLREASHRGGTRSRRRWCYPPGASPQRRPSAVESPLETRFGLRSFSHGLTEHRREGSELGANRQMTCNAIVIALKCTEHGCSWHALSHTAAWGRCDDPTRYARKSESLPKVPQLINDGDGTQRASSLMSRCLQGARPGLRSSGNRWACVLRAGTVVCAIVSPRTKLPVARGTH